MSFRNEQVESQQYQKQGQPRPPTNIPASRSKKDVMSTDRLHISPSPIKKADISQNRAKGKVEVNQVPQSLKDTTEGSGSHKIMIRQFELVEFTKKFAIQKADYEDRIEALMLERDNLKLAVSRLEADIRQASHLLSSRDSLQALEITRNQKIIHELQSMKARTDGELSAVRNENNRLHSELNNLDREAEGLRKLLTAQRSKNSDLDRIKLSMIDSNNKLSDENHQLVLATKKFEDALNETRIELRAMNKSQQQLTSRMMIKEEELRHAEQATQNAQQALRSNTLEFEIACMKVITLSAALEFESKQKRQLKDPQNRSPTDSVHNRSVRSNEEELRMNLNILQIESDHIKQQFLLEKEKLHVNHQHLQEENSRLSEELREKNRRIFELTIQNSHPEMKSSSIHNTSEMRESKRVELNTSCGQARLSTSRHNLKCHQCEGNLNSRRSRQNSENMNINSCSPCKMCMSMEKQLTAAKNRYDNLNRELLDAKSYIEQLQANREEIAEQYEYLKAELTEHLAIKCENKRITAKVKMMEEVIVTLKAENQQLKQLNVHREQQHHQQFHRQLRELVFAYEKDRLTSHEDLCKLEQQVNDLKSQLNTSSSFQQQLCVEGH